MSIETKVQQLKSSFTVEGTPLFRSNRFAEEEIDKMKSNSACHQSHWHGFGKNDKIWSDEEIATQIEVFLITPIINEQNFENIVNRILIACPIENKDDERKAFREVLFAVLNWTEEKNGISEMWKKFGSAPNSSDGKFHGNKDLERYAKLYGAVSMHEIFDGLFSEKFHIFWYRANNALSRFESFWNDAKRKKDLKAKTFISPYNSLDEIEENVVVKKISESAKEFYLDNTKSFKERVKVFSKHGNQESSIFEPTDVDLEKIFKIFMEGENERHSIINCADVVYDWIYTLKSGRTHLNWNNPYHPDIDTKKRNYVPSEQAIERLHRYYMKKLFLEGVGSFELDW